MRPGIWPVVAGLVAATTVLLLTASGSGLTYVQRRMLLSSQPLAGGMSLSAGLALPKISGVVGNGSPVKLPDSAGSKAFKKAYKRCREAAEGVAPLPKLKRAASWEGSNSSADGNTTVVTTLHIERLPLLEAHCAVWPHTIMAAVYAPLSASGRVVCLDEVATPEQLRQGRSGSWLSWLGLGPRACAYEGWSVARLRKHVRSMQKQAEEAGQCNLRVDLWTEQVSTVPSGVAVGLLPQAALQNRALLALKPEEAEDHRAVVLLDSDMVSVDIWQLVNWPSRWDRALRVMGQGAALVLPAFQLAPPGAVQGALGGAAKTAMEVATAESGKFPLRELYEHGNARVYEDHGFDGSQAAALPELWFEAGDMHGADDNGYPVTPQAGFAPFVMMLQRHVPWADERLRGSYYQRAWQAVVSTAMGTQHIVQPNAFALQLPHQQAYSRGEAELSNFLAVEPVFRQLVEELAAGEYVPVTSFGEDCAISTP